MWAIETSQVYENRTSRQTATLVGGDYPQTSHVLCLCVFLKDQEFLPRGIRHRRCQTGYWASQRFEIRKELPSSECGNCMGKSNAEPSSLKHNSEYQEILTEYEDSNFHNWLSKSKTGPAVAVWIKLCEFICRPRPRRLFPGYVCFAIP